ncbi:hypothetical protein BIV57_01515 [Mangrovactinospora gilvigrisea]|uniref:Lipoprotein n=1 Tax=Mangrovactinospora gilvigrisea TaxID=1428644 RepID=A0A1J7CCD9_9ACTN|nr:hypothetical protein [Mangrovactinospora gilvigrisea]OIV39192.1 hypothetical protein BIV57_01515 [Mangrovactinospora gilvigrisea]
MRSPDLRTTAAAAATAALAVALTACGASGSGGHGAIRGAGGSGSPSAARAAKAAHPAAASAVVLRTVAANTRKAATAHVRMTMSSPGQAASVGFAGTMGWGARSGTDGAYTGIPAAPFQQPDGKVYARSSGLVFYYKLSPAAAAKSGKHWMKLDMAALAARSGASGLSSGLQNQVAQDPSADVAALATAGVIKDRGTTTLDGRTVHEYSGDVPASRLVAARPGLTPAQRRAELKALTGAGLTSTSVDVWVNADHYPVKLDQTVHGSTALRIVATFDHYGTALDTTPPPASDTIDANQQPAAGSGA